MKNPLIHRNLRAFSASFAAMVCTLILGIATARSQPTDVDAITGFQGIAFGTRFKDVRGLQEVFTSKDGRYVVAKRSGDPTKYNGFPIHNFYYRFIDGIFYEGVIQLKDHDEEPKLIKLLEEEFGQPYARYEKPASASSSGMQDPSWVGRRNYVAPAHREHSVCGALIGNMNFRRRLDAWLAGTSSEERGTRGW